MTPEHIQCIQTTWAEIAPDASHAMAAFYRRLFAIDPAIAPLFANTSMYEQQTRLAATLQSAIDRLHDIEGVTTVLQALGKKHAPYPIDERHFESVGDALLWTLEHALGPAWSAEAKAAWGSLYGTVASTMLEAIGDERARNSNRESH